MSDAKFTPGPWRFNADEENDCTIWHKNHICVAQRARANDARLIAAAPEMYEALEKIKYALENLGGGLPNNDFLEPYFLAKRAIAKAKGETNE